MKTVGIIPARYQSSRFPGKPLVELCGKPMIIRVAELTAKALGDGNTFVATDDRRIGEVVSNAGFQCIYTSDNALTGTDRIWEAAQQVAADIYINVQGDEPLLDPKDIKKIVEAKVQHFDWVINGMCELDISEDPENVNIPKVVTAENNMLIYMSRLAIPGFKSAKNRPEKYYKQVCIYGFNYKELEAFGTYGRKSALEKCEDIEILRFLDLKRKVLMVETSGASLAVDIEDDVVAVEAAIAAQGL